MADIAFTCPYCEQKIEAPDELAGAAAECPACKCELQIPNQPAPTQEPAQMFSTPPPPPAAKTHFIAAKCPSCGGDLQVPENRDHVKCMYCGGTVIVQQAIQAAASGPNVANLMELAQAAAHANNPKEAYDYYTRALEYDPRNPKAWAGKGEAAGWMSTVADIRTTEMLAAFKNAINCATDSEKPALRIQCAAAINRVTVACYSIARKHAETFFDKVPSTWTNHIKICGNLLAALIIGNAYDPDNKICLENIIHICAENIRGLKVSSTFGLTVQKTILAPNYKAHLKATIDEYFAKLTRLDPNHQKPKV